MRTASCLAQKYPPAPQGFPEGELLTPDIHDWWQMLMGLGRKWYYPDSTCPNLLDEGVTWKKLMGSYYEEPKD